MSVPELNRTRRVSQFLWLHSGPSKVILASDKLVLAMEVFSVGNQNKCLLMASFLVDGCSFNPLFCNNKISYQLPAYPTPS